MAKQVFCPNQLRYLLEHARHVAVNPDAYVKPLSLPAGATSPEKNVGLLRSEIHLVLDVHRLGLSQQIRTLRVRRFIADNADERRRADCPGPSVAMQLQIYRCHIGDRKAKGEHVKLSKQLQAELEPLCRPGAADRQPERTTRKMRAARAALLRRFHCGFAGDAEVFPLLDVLALACNADPTLALKDAKILRNRTKRRIERKTPDQFIPYAVADWFSGTGSVARLCIEYERQAGWLPRFRVTIYANDAKGLLPADLLQILEAMPFTHILALELALDFPLVSGVSRDFIRRHGVFGKSRRDRSTKSAVVDYWGSRRARKRTKLYEKWEIAALRLEWRLRKSFLDTHGVKDVFDFRRLAEVLLDRHILFADLGEERLGRRLRHGGYSTTDIRAIFQTVRERGADLCAVLDYLRRDVRLKNVRRLLDPRPENELVRRALKRWAGMWPVRPGRLGR